MIWNRLACWSSALLMALLILVPLSASAQQASGIAGEVTDDTGGVLPGVTVEASSPALIEQVRTAVTDGQGRYNIVDLRPGTYTVTFTLPGFATIVREGVELTAGFTANIDAAMQVGGIEETITVTGESPLVDIQNVRQQQVVSDELLRTLPSSTKNVAQTLIMLVPGITGTTDVGGSSGLYRSNGQSGGMFFHGKSDITALYDGMGMSASATAIFYVLNTATAEETTVVTGGGSAESGATVVMNLIPKVGGNTFGFDASGTYTSDRLQTNNLTDDLRARGLTHPNEVLLFYDANVTVGGPIRRDRLWFFTASRAVRSKNTVPGVFFNKTLGTPFYTPDPDRPAYRGVVEEPRRPGHVAGIGEKQGEWLCRYPAFLQSGTGGICLAGGVHPHVELLATGVRSGHLDLAGVQPASARSRHVVHGGPYTLPQPRRRGVCDDGSGGYLHR